MEKVTVCLRHVKRYPGGKKNLEDNSNLNCMEGQLGTRKSRHRCDGEILGKWGMNQKKMALETRKNNVIGWGPGSIFGGQRGGQEHRKCGGKIC